MNVNEGLEKLKKNDPKTTTALISDAPRDNWEDVVQEIETEMTTRAENDSHIISDPEKFVKEYNDPSTYRNIDDFTIVAFVESHFYAKSNELILSKSEFITAELFKALMPLASGATIKILRLQSLQIKGRALKYLSKCRCISLKELEINNCPNIESQSIDQYFHSPESLLRNMEKLIFKKVNIEDACIVSLLNASNKMKQIKELIFADCARLTADAFAGLFNNNFENLRLLHFENIKLGEKVLAKFSEFEALKNLESLTLIKVAGITENSLLEFFRSPHLVSIKTLELRSLPNIKGLFLNEFLTKTSLLISFKISDFPHFQQDQLENFLKSPQLQNLQTLEISQMNSLLDSFMGLLTSLTNLEGLHELTLNNYLKMTSSSVVLLLSSALTNTVRNLSIEYCTGLSEMPSSYDSLKKCNLANLERLSFNYCTSISKYLLEIIGNIPSLSNLKVLSLIGIPNVDDNVCLALTRYNTFKNLRELYLDNCPNFTIKSFQEFMRNVLTVNLEVFSLNGNSQLNDDIWNFINSSKNLQKLRDIRLKGLNITSQGIDQLILHDKMLNIEYMTLSNACLAFPSFYQTEKCSKLKKIEGSWEDVANEDVENLLKSTVLSPEFQFQDLIDQLVELDDDMIIALTDSKLGFLKKIWEFPQCSTADINPESLQYMLSSPNLNPFFNIDRLLKDMKAIINDDILETMAKNPLCVNNLFELDVLGSREVTSEGIRKILTSKFLCPLFNISGFIKSVQCYYGTQASLIIPSVAKGNFCSLLKRLDLGDYELEDGILRLQLLLKPNVFKCLRTLNLSNTNINDEDLKALGEHELMDKLYVLSLNENPRITPDGFEAFFTIIGEKERVDLKTLMLEYCNITNPHLIMISTSPYAKNLRYLALAGCKDIDGEGLSSLIDLINKYKRIDSKKILEDFPHYISIGEGNKFIIRKEIIVDTNEVLKFLQITSDNLRKKAKNDNSEKTRLLIRDQVMIEITKDKRIDTLRRMDLNNCCITSRLLIELSICSYLKNLRELNLQNTNIDDSGVEALCNSRNLISLRVLDLTYCNRLTKISLKNILRASFNSEFNPDKILSHFGQKIDRETIESIPSSRFFRNMVKLNLSQNNDLSLNDLETLIKMQKERKDNLLLEINVNLGQIFDKHKSEIKDELLQMLAESRIISSTKTLDLAGASISAEGLQAIFVSKYINTNFLVQPLINSFSNLIDDDLLNALSRGNFFRNMTQINLKACSKISILGLLNIARSPNPDFDIQGLLDDFGDKIDSLFIKNMVQQDYFEKLQSLVLTNCRRLTTEDLMTIIKGCHEDFDLESFIKPENLPNNNPDLITNEILKAISQSAGFVKNFIVENTNDENRRYFDFNIKFYRRIDSGINYLIENNVAPLEDYDDYLQNFSYYLSFKSLIMINNIYEKSGNDESLKEQLSHVKKLDFSQNKQIYNSSLKSRLVDAFESFQSQHNLNLEDDTVDYFVNVVIKVQDDFNMTSDIDEEFKDIEIFKLIKNCKNLEEINLNNLNLGDYFLKVFSLYIAEGTAEIHQNLPLLRVFKLRNNCRFTSVGLKYLFCAAVKRTDIEIIDVTYKGQVNSGITYFVNNGLIGMIDYYIKHSINTLWLIFEKKRKRPIKFCFNLKTQKILFLYIINSGFIVFHGLEKLLYYLPYCLLAILRPLNITKYFLKCVDACFRCFDFNIQKKEKEAMIASASGTVNGSSPLPVVPKKKSCFNPLHRICGSLFKKKERDEDIQKIYDMLDDRYYKCMNNMASYLSKDYEMVKQQSLFYFDETLVVLNDILGNQYKHNNLANNQVFSLSEQDLTTFHDHMTNKFYLISKLRWVFLINFLCFFTVSIFYLIFLKVKWNQNGTLFWQIPYFGYGVLNFCVELYMCWEVIEIIGNSSIISIYSPFLIASLFSSQAAKYDFFTDVTFVLSLYDLNPDTKEATFDNIFVASLSVLTLKLSITLWEFLEFCWKYFIKRGNHKTYSSKNINSFSKTCFVFEFHGLGRLLDKFSTASAKKYKYWWLPKSFYNVYIPMVITATFMRLFIEDIPQLIIQTINIVGKGSIQDFTILASLFSTIFTMFLTLHTAWNVRPSYFSRDLFKLYHDNLVMGSEEEDDESMSQSSSHVEGISFDPSEHRSVGSYDDRSQNDHKDEQQTDEKDEEREELFGGGRQKKIFFKGDI